jgi:flagellar L-ring protein precursor FlgH
MKSAKMLCVMLCASGAAAQSLYEAPVETAPLRPGEAPSPARAPGAAPALAQVSLIAVEAPAPRQFQAEDLVTIIISERSKLDRKHKTDSKKDYDNDLTVSRFIDLIELLETRIQPTSSERLPRIGVSSGTKFKGDAKYQREDQMTDRVTAKILEVKPNGTMVLEARRSFQSDEEDTSLILSGVCRSEDVTDRNTVQSNQLYDLSLKVESSGELHRTNRKGLIPRILETVLNF